MENKLILPYEINKIHNVDCVVGMGNLPESSIDFVCTSPPYNVGIDYDTWDDSKSMEEYYDWCKKWTSQMYRVLKDDGRIAINIPYEMNTHERGGRIFILSEYWQILKSVGFNFFGVIDLSEKSPHRVKQTAWGSWMSPSCPYIYNPKEAVILAYKKSYKKLSKGIPEWEKTNVEKLENGEKIIKKDYLQRDKNEFMELVYGNWNYLADTKSLTKATFSLDIPMRAIKILTYKDELVLDPFSGSGTTALAAKITGRRYIGFEISSNYSAIANSRVNSYLF